MTKVTGKTKLVRITLAALTRVEYSEVLEVPANIKEDELNALVDQRYEDVDGGNYTDDAEYWERSESCGHEMLDAESAIAFKPDFTVRRVKGEFKLTAMPVPDLQAKAN